MMKKSLILYGISENIFWFWRCTGMFEKILQNNFCLIVLNRNKDNHNLLPLHSFASNSITRDPTGGVIVSGHLKTAGGS